MLELVKAEQLKLWNPRGLFYVMVSWRWSKMKEIDRQEGVHDRLGCHVPFSSYSRCDVKMTQEKSITHVT